MLLQLTIVGGGALALFVPVLCEILERWRRDPAYRSLKNVRRSVCDYYRGYFAARAFKRLGTILHLIDVQWPLMTYKALAAFRCDASGDGSDERYLRAAPGDRCDGVRPPRGIFVSDTSDAAAVDDSVETSRGGLD